MTMDKFFHDTCTFSASSYYYRVEFQQRGAPHIHCLVWLEDIDGTPAPTFWTVEPDKNEDNNSDDENEDRKQLQKIKKIQSIANLLICSSVNQAFCDRHQDRINKLHKEIDSCNLCFYPSLFFNFRSF